MRFCWLFCKMKKKICKMKKKNWEMKKNPASQHRFCWAKWRKRFSKWRKKISKWRKNFLNCSYLFLNYTKKTHKLKKAICTFIFLFFNAQNYSCCSKISKRFTRESQMGTRESQNGHSGLLKWLVSLVISKLALLPILRLPLAHLRLPHEPFLKFSSQQEKFFSSKKEKNKRTKYYCFLHKNRCKDC